MVNCNPETVSTDYDTSDRLYFEPLGAEEVLDVCDREHPAGVVIQFGGQTPLKLAREIEADGWHDPRHAVRRGRPGRGSRAVRARSATSSRSVPVWGMAESPDAGGRRRRARSATRCSSAPRYVLGGREHAGLLRRRGPSPRRPRSADGARRQLPRRRDRDRRRRALRRPRDLRRRGHGARRGGRRPLRRLLLRATRAVARRQMSRGSRRSCKRLAPALGVVGLVNVQLAVAGRRGVRARGEPARVAHRAVRQQGDRRQPRRGCLPRSPPASRLADLDLPRGPTPGTGRVKAAVLPFARFPGADPVLGPEMRSTGEVMASAADLPTAFAKAERAAGRPLPMDGTAFLSVRDADKTAAVEVAASLSSSGSAWSRRSARRTRSPPPGSRSSACAR